MKKEFERLKKQLEGFREMHQIFREMRSHISQGRKEELICRQFRKLTEARDTTLFLLNPKNERYQFRAAVGKGERKYAGGFLETDEKLKFSTESDLRAAHSEVTAVQTKSRVYVFRDKPVMIVPITALSRVYGMLFCEYDNAWTIDDDDRAELIGVFLNQLSLFFECYVDTQRMEEKARSLELLYEIGSKLSSIRDEEQLLETIMVLIEKNIHVDRCSLMILDENRKYLRIKKAFGKYDVDIDRIKVPLGEGIAGHVAVGTRPLLIKDLASEKHLISQVPQKKNFRTQSLLSVPLISQGEVIGVINVNNRKDGLPFSEADMYLLSKIASEIAAVLKRSYMALQLKKARELDNDIKRFIV